MNGVGELDRRIDLSHAIMQRLDNGEILSNVLSQAQLLMKISGKPIMAALLDLLSYGLTNTPSQGQSFTNPEYKKAGKIYCSLCSVEDISNLDVDQVNRNIFGKRAQEKNHILTISVYEMENLEKPEKMAYISSDEIANRYLQLGVYYNRAKSILSSLRNYIYIEVGNVWAESIKEKDAINLLGQNYKLITDKLSTLDTAAGAELLASINNLFSNNPANWSLCALGCRQVIIKLGSLLWKVPVDIYIKTNGNPLNVGKEKEKNRLFAYIDHFSQKADNYKLDILKEAEKLVKSIYDEGSKGKNPIRKEVAQALLVDTFHFVDILNQATGLMSIDNLSE